MIRMQQISWYLLTIYFAATVLIGLFMPHVARGMAWLGVTAILLITLARTFVMARQFQHAHMFRFSLLSWLLAFLILSTVLLRFLGK